MTCIKTFTKHFTQILFLVITTAVISGCGSSSTSSAPVDLWTWISGSNIVDQSGIYGTKGTANPANVPGARYDSISWTDVSGNLWFFGGVGRDSTGTSDYLNDLWRWDGSNWTWISGNNVVNQSGTYGTQGLAAGANVPGARRGPVSWTDASGNLWLFGGYGYDSDGTLSYLNDLWRWDGTNWTWVSGSNVIEQSGIYGTKGTANPANVPGARWASTSWTDASGDFWLFGGYGYDSGVTSSELNDLWRWDGSNWTWISGSNVINQNGTYGTQGLAAGANVPGARNNSTSWADASGDFWLFGGLGYDSAGILSYLNDLWRWDGAEWTWVSGSNVIEQSGIYGTQGLANGANVPGARDGSISWTDANGNLWLFGGLGYDSAGANGYLNDLWRWDGSNWTWISGSNVINQNGTYGTQGLAAGANVPGAKYKSISWTDANGNLWLFGGFGRDSAGTLSYLNDLWRYEP